MTFDAQSGHHHIVEQLRILIHSDVDLVATVNGNFLFHETHKAKHQCTSTAGLDSVITVDIGDGASAPSFYSDGDAWQAKAIVAWNYLTRDCHILSCDRQEGEKSKE